MKEQSYCRFGSYCKKNMKGICNYKHKKEQKKRDNEHKSKSNKHSRERERSRSEERQKDQQKYKEYKVKHNNYKNREDNYESRKRYEQIDPKKQVSKSNHQVKRKYEQKPKSEDKSKSKDIIEYPQKKKNSEISKKLQTTKQPQISKHSQKQKQSEKHNNISKKSSQSETNNFKIPFEIQFSKFCKSYHLQDMCNNKDKCHKIHSFMFQDHDFIKRRVFLKSSKFTKDVKICYSVHPQAIQFVIKNTKQLIFYQYTPGINQIKQISANNLQKTKNPKRQYFGCEGAALFFSFINNDNFYDILYFDLVSNNCFEIKNAHLKEVTGVIHLNSQKLISVSLDGTLKAWTFDKLNFRLNYDSETSLRFNKLLTFSQKKIELLFIYKTIFGDKELLLIGTSNSKLLIFGNQTPLSFKQIIVSQTQFKIVKTAKINKSKESLQMLILAQGRTSSAIYRLTIEGENTEKKEKLVELENSHEKRINTFDVNSDLLVISYGNQVILYSLKSKVTAIGGMLYQNPIQQIVIAQYFLKSTAVRFTVMAVLQGASSEDKQDGLFSIYFIK